MTRIGDHVLPPDAVPDELDVLRRRLRTFIDDELLPVERQHRLADEHQAPVDLRRWVRQRSRELSLFTLFQPRELGGGGLGPLGLAILHETVGASGSVETRWALNAASSIAVFNPLIDALSPVPLLSRTSLPA